MKREFEMNNSTECEIQPGTDTAAKAKGALERVCSGKALDSPSHYYSQEFVDHVIFKGLRALGSPLLCIQRFFRILMWSSKSNSLIEIV